MTHLLDADDYLDQSVAATGLDDFGDPTFRLGLQAFLDSAEEARLNEIGTAAADGQIRGALASRLAVIDWQTTHPEVADERVEAPIFIIGLSRSGTTALSHLLARDPANRSLLGWEAAQPVPPPQPDTYTTDPRFEAAKADEFGLLHQLNPALTAMHHDPPDMPVECLVPMTQHFVTLSLALVFPVFSYGRWVRDTDHGPLYRYHHQVLRVLQSGGVRGRWQLKSPQHTFALDALTNEYPDARFIVTHRDPATVVASVTSMAHAFASTFADAPHAAAVGREWTDLMGAVTDGLLDFRRRHGDDRFVDISYRDVVQRPVEAARRAYAGLGLTLSPEGESAMRAHTETAVQHRYGRHQYQLEDLGLDRAALDERFETYRARFAEELTDAR